MGQDSPLLVPDEPRRLLCALAQPSQNKPKTSAGFNTHTSRERRFTLVQVPRVASFSLGQMSKSQVQDLATDPSLLVLSGIGVLLSLAAQRLKPGHSHTRHFSPPGAPPSISELGRQALASHQGEDPRFAVWKLGGWSVKNEARWLSGCSCCSEGSCINPSETEGKSKAR